MEDASSRAECSPLATVVIDTPTVAPATHGKQQRHRVILFPIRRGPIDLGVPSVFIDPTKVAYIAVLSIDNEHVAVRPTPERAKLALFVHLHGNHHTLTHPRSMRVVISPVCYLGHWAGGFEVDALR